MKRFQYLLMMGHLCTDINQGALPAILPFLIASQNLSYASAASLVLAANLVSSVIQPLLGYWGDKRSLPWIMSLGVLMAGGGVALIGISTSYWFAFFAAGVSGFGIAMFHPEGGRLANYVAGNQKGSGLSIFAVGGNLGFALGPIIAASAISLWGLKGIIIFLLPTSIMAGLILFFTPQLKQVAPVAKPAEGIVRSETRSDDWVAFSKVSSIVFCRSIIHYGLMTFIPLFFIGQLLLSETAANGRLTLYSLFGAVATLLGGRFADQIGLKRVIYLCLFSLAPMLFIMLQFNSSLIATIALVPMALVMNGGYSSLIVLGQSFVPNHIGFASGISLGLSVSIGGLCAPVIGWIGDTYGLMAGMYTINGIAFLMLLLSFILPDASATHPAASSEVVRVSGETPGRV